MVCAPAGSAKAAPTMAPESSDKKPLRFMRVSSWMTGFGDRAGSGVSGDCLTSAPEPQVGGTPLDWAPMQSVIAISQLTKTYASGLQALKSVDLEIPKGEIFALLGPNGAGKTTLINIVCGIVTPTSGTVLADGHDIQREYRGARRKIGLVPQELTTDAFETVWATVTFSRGLFGRPKNPQYV